MTPTTETALLLRTLAYGPCFLVRDCWLRITTGKWTKL